MSKLFPKKFPALLSLPLFLLVLTLTFSAGFIVGTINTTRLIGQQLEQQGEFVKTKPTPSPAGGSSPAPKAQPLKPNYTGPELWEAVNKARVTHGVNALSQRDILCTISAIRLSQIRELGKLDNHEGFDGVYEKYKDDPEMPNNVAEFLISGYPTAEQAVEGWLDTLGHKKLITGGEYVWGCIYAQDGFGVAITGF
ncbi:MAG: hypothetical protein HY377_01900 [Candidatus Blackburnbacteria bacterium]|nr:hypothetical protein [Candidatus Blackburnbacteria bacterium]